MEDRPSKLTPSQSVVGNLGRTLPDSQATPTPHATPTGHERKERRSSKRERRPKGGGGSSLTQQDGRDFKGVRRSSHLEAGTPRRVASDDSMVQEDPSVVSSPHVGTAAPKGSPLLLRRRPSRDELLPISPNPDSREVFSSPVGGGGRKDGGSDTGSHLSTSSSVRTTGSSGAGLGKGSEGDKSLEIMVDDVSGSSLSTSSFDVSIQLLNATSPP